MSDIDRHGEFLDRAFVLSKLAIGHTWPNPLVGAVIVNDGKICGEGFHQRYGGPHAEVEAIRDFFSKGGNEAQLQKVTLYCTLEPCCHTQKKTPPCVGEILKYKIPHVVISAIDPYPMVAGKGVEQLRQAGVQVEIVHHRYDEYKKLNAPFWCAIEKNRPHVHAKWAQTLDGKMARVNGDSKWITGETSRAAGHFLRGTHQAIIVGAQTAINDNPSLNVRYQWQGVLPNPLRVVIQGSKPLPDNLNLFSDESQKTLVIRTNASPEQNWGGRSHIEVVTLAHDENYQVDAKDILKTLFDRKIISVMIEGGPKLIGNFLNHDLIDEVSIFIAPKIFGDGLSPTENMTFSHLKEFMSIESPNWTNYGPDIAINGRPLRAIPSISL